MIPELVTIPLLSHCKISKSGIQVPGSSLVHCQMHKMTITINTKQRALEWDVELVAAHPLRAALQFNLKSVKYTVTGIPRRFPAIPWELMLPGMFVLEYKSCCQFQCACQRSKTSTQPDWDDRKHTDRAWVVGERSSLERWLEKRVCLCIKERVCMKSCGFNCACMCAWLIAACVYIHPCE